MGASRRVWVLTAASILVIGLFALALGRFVLADSPDLPSFASTRAPRFRDLPTWPEIAPGAAPLRGLVVDPDGAAVPEVLVYGRPHDMPTWAVTDAEGRFELPWPEGEAETVLAVLAWGFPPLELPAARGSEELRIALPAREVPPPPVPEVVPAPIAGRVRTARADDAPPYAFEVVFEPAEAASTLAAPVMRRVACAPDATFELADLAAGKYLVHVLPDWAAGGSWPDLLGEPVPLEHDPANPRPLELDLTAGALSGTLTDRRGRTVEGALLLLSPAAEPGHLWPPATSDTRGGFLIEDLPPGSYRLFVEAGDARVEGLEVEVAAGTRVEIEVPPLAVRRRN